MALRLDLNGIKKVKETIKVMGGIVPIADFGFSYKGKLIHCLSVVEEAGFERLKFLHYYSDGIYKELHPKTAQVNDIVKMFNEKCSF